MSFDLEKAARNLAASLSGMTFSDGDDWTEKVLPVVRDFLRAALLAGQTGTMSQREFAICQALARAALIAVAGLPTDDLSRGIVRHQVDRLRSDLAQSLDERNRLNAAKLAGLIA